VTNSYLDLTDMFCGCGGSSQGAQDAGVEVKLAMNHWDRAIESHNTNFPGAEHVCADVYSTDPRRYRSTTLLWASPECTNHANAKGQKRAPQQASLLEDSILDPSAIRSRATMWDVPRFAEYHNYKAIIVENVVEARQWRLWDAWLHAMRSLDYDYKILYLNSMFFGVPQSRDRLYAVFWKKGTRAPDLDFRPPAHCPNCDKVVYSIQSWKKPNKPWGRYDGGGQRRQYYYRCPTCAEIVHPGTSPALTVIDWADTGIRIGDRKQPLKPRTLERIQRGLDKYGGQYLVVDTAYSHAKNQRTWPADQPMSTQTTRQTKGLAVPPSSVIVFRREADGQSPADPLTTITAGAINHGLARMPFFVLAYTPGYSKPVNQSLSTVTPYDHHQLIQRIPFLASYYQGNNPQAVDQPMPVLTTLERHALVQPETVAIEDCYFRMLKPMEIKLGMGLGWDYAVLGTKREQVRQCGQAVTPPPATWIFNRITPVL